MIAGPDKFVMKNYISANAKENQMAVHTELTMHPNEFQTFCVNSDCSITYCLKELRAMIALADAFDLPLNASYGVENEPIYFTVSRADVFEGSLVMATMASEDPSDRADTSISSSINSSQSSSTFRGTEDLLGGFRSRPRTPSNANTNAVRSGQTTKSSTTTTPSTSKSALRGNESNSSIRFVNEVQEAGDEQVSQQPTNILSLSQSNSSQRQNDPRTSTLDIAQSTPPNFSEGLHDMFDQTENHVKSPPSKRAKFFFQRCFEKTMDLRTAEARYNLLAPDSDEEN